MKKNYTRVLSQTFVNAALNTFWTIKLALHNEPTVTVIGGKIGTRGRTKHLFAESREQAREFFEEQITEQVEQGFAQVA